MSGVSSLGYTLEMDICTHTKNLLLKQAECGALLSNFLKHYPPSSVHITDNIV